MAGYMSSRLLFTPFFLHSTRVPSIPAHPVQPIQSIPRWLPPCIFWINKLQSYSLVDLLGTTRLDN